MPAIGISRAGIHRSSEVKVSFSPSVTDAYLKRPIGDNANGPPKRAVCDLEIAAEQTTPSSRSFIVAPRARVEPANPHFVRMGSASGGRGCCRGRDEAKVESQVLHV